MPPHGSSASPPLDRAPKTLEVAEMSDKMAVLLAVRETAEATYKESMQLPSQDALKSPQPHPDHPDHSDHSAVVPEPPSWSLLLWLVRNLVCLGTAFMVHYIAMKGAVNLQSSVYVEDGLGTAGLSSYYAGFLLSNILLPSITIKYLGCKLTTIVCILAYIPYIASQFHARFYTLVPSGLLAGLAAGPMWVAQGTYLSHMSTTYERSSSPNEVMMLRLFGIFYMLYQMSQVWGNLISSAVLSQGLTEEDLSPMRFNDTREVCGAKFSADNHLSVGNLHRDKPPEEKIAIITGVYIACMVVAAIIVMVGVDAIPRAGSNKNRKKSKTNGGATQTKENEANNVEKEKEEKEETEGKEVEEDGSKSGEYDTALGVLGATLRIGIKPELLLLIPITTFLGVEDTFLAADYTASYVSCAWGIANIGYVMICYGVTNSIASALGGCVVKLTGRYPVVLAATVLQVAVVAALQLWQPHSSDTILFFVMAGLWGVTDGIWQAQINAIYGILYPGDEEAAYSCFRLWEGVGYIIAYGYSSYLPTSTKLWSLLALMLLGVLGYTADEVLLRKKSKSNEKCPA